MTPNTSSDPAESTDYAAARQAMIDSQLRPQGVTDPSVIAAMAAVPRETFVPQAARAMAYSDRMVPLGEGRSLSPPAALGMLLEALLPMAGERALVIGAGAGYSAAVLAAMGLKVTALDDSEIPQAGAAFDRVKGVLGVGNAAGAPYDLILVDGAIPAIPDAIVAQLGDGGRLGAGLIDQGIAKLVVGRKSGTAFGLRSIGDSGLPHLPGFAKPREFTF
ncbi:MAG: protein-L-isoaspartate O-methyltransferase [Sphingomicrobium sp.]